MFAYAFHREKSDERYAGAISARLRLVARLHLPRFMADDSDGGSSLITTCLIVLCQQWPLADGFYYIMMSVLTVGFGDVVPQR